MNTKISNYILYGFLIILFLFSVTTYNDYRLSVDIKESTEYLTRSSEIVQYSTRLQRNVLKMVSGLQGYLLTGDVGAMSAYREARSDIDSVLQQLPPLLENEKQRQSLNEIASVISQWNSKYTAPLLQAMPAIAPSDETFAGYRKVYRHTIAEGRRLEALLLDNLNNFTNAEYTLREQRKKELTTTVTGIKTISYLLTGISVFVAIIIIVIIIRKISNRIRQMTRLANSIAVGNYSINISEIGNDELSELGYSLNHMAGELEKNINLLKRKNEELDQFAHIVSHDMKGPLRGISNVVTWIDEDHQSELTPKIKEYMDLIKGRISRAENLIEGILSYARIERDELAKEPVDVKELIGEIVDNLPAVAQRYVRLEEMPVINAERVLLLQIFSNLINNAIKYNDKKEPAVTVFCEEHEGYYEFFVEDNGKGIAPQYHRRIFEIFQTLRDKDSYESTGIGLTIVRKILETKKQQINLVSEPEKGSVFSFSWPKE